jgi:ribosomal protein S1
MGVGFISGVQSHGVFIKCLGSCSFFAPLKYLMDGTISEEGVLPIANNDDDDDDDDGDQRNQNENLVSSIDPFEFWSLHQTVRFRVMKLYGNTDNDSGKTKKAIVSLRISDVDTLNTNELCEGTEARVTLHADFLQARLDDEREIYLNELAHSDDADRSNDGAGTVEEQDSEGQKESNDDGSDAPNPSIKSIVLGNVVMGTILHCKTYGVLLQLEGNVLALAVNAHVDARHKQKDAIGTTVPCRVLYVDYKTSIVDVSLLTRLVDKQSQKRAKKVAKLGKNQKIGSVLTACVELVKKDNRVGGSAGNKSNQAYPNFCAIVTLTKKQNAFALCLTSLFNGPSRREDAQLQHGQVAKLIVVGRVRGVDGTAILVMLPRTVAIASNLKITSDSLSSTAKANKQRRKRDRANSEVDTLMLVGSDEVKAKQSQAKQQKAKDLQPGSLVDVRIKRIFRREMLVQAVRVQGIALGTVHITDVVDTPELLKLAKQSTKAQAERQQIKGTRLTDNEDHSLFSRFEVGGYARACVVAVLDNERDKSGARKNHKKKKARRTSNSDNKDDEGEDDEGEDDEEESQKEEVFRFAFSLRPSETSEAKKQDDNPVTQDFLQERTTWSNVMSKYNTSNGQAVKLVGFVTDIKSEFAQVEFSRGVSGSIDIVDTISQSFLPEGIMPPSRAINKKKKARKGKVLQTDGENNVISDSQMELGLISNRHELSQLSLASKFKIGQAITVRIISSDSKKHHLRCSTILNDENACTYAPGAVVICRVREIVRATIDQALRVQMPNNCVGRICVSDVRAKHDWIDDQLGKLIHQLRSIDVTGKSISVNSNLLVQDTSSKPVNNCRGVRLVRARVVSVCRKEGAKDNTYDLALFRTSSSLPSGEVAKATTPSTGEHKKRKSEAISIGQSNESIVLSASNSTSDAIVEGALLTGFVANASARGVFVRVSRSLTARVFPRNLADHFIKNVSDEFPRGKLVAGRVITVRTSSVKGKRQKSKNKSPKSANLRVELTLKPSEVAGNLDEDVEEWEKLAVGSIVEGRVKSMKDFGIFIRIDGTEIDGLAHRTQCADEIQVCLSLFFLI